MINILALEVAQRVFQLHQLDEEIMLGIQARGRHRRLEVEAQPLLNARVLQLRRALGEVQKQHQVEHNRRRENRVAAQEIDLDLHRIAEPAEDVDVIPALFVITARRVIVDAHLVIDILVKIGVELGLQNVFEHPSFDSSLVLKDSGSSSTSPSRLPRMLVEYQPLSPSMRALKPGASTVFISVWPVLKSLPQMGASFFVRARA